MFMTTELSALIEAEMERFGVPGVAVTVVADGAVVLCDGFGLRDMAGRRPVTARTLFPIASATKTFTAALCALLVDEGVLAWDRPVRGYLPGFQLVDPAATEGLTVHDMLCHRSGLPRHDLLWYSAAGETTRTELVEALRHLEPSRGFRETFQYNNLLYACAGEIAGRLCGGSYESVVRKRLLDPLGMHRTNLSIAETAADDDAARGYAAPAPGEPVAEVEYAPLGPIAPAGAINSCAEDLGPWLMTLLGRGVGDRPPLLSADVLTAMRTPAISLSDPSLFLVGDPVGYGLGLMIEDYRGHRVVFHGGNIDGFSSQVAVVPEAGCAVAVLAGREGTALRDALPHAILDRLLGLDPRPHGATLLAREEAVLRGHAQGRERLVTGSAALPPVRPLRDYAGRYRDPGYGELVITESGDGLDGRYRALAGPVVHRHLEVFNLMVDLLGVATPLPLQFFHDLEGEVTAAALSLEEAVAPIRFERVPETGHLTGELLDRLAGTYRLGPLTATVGRRGPDGLTARIGPGVPAELVPVRDLIFTMNGGRVEFTDDGRLLTSAGDFTRDP
ncbi:serine hydrolase [Actinoallomurus oryzae]|uniref:Serine hydrolase n=2 Tax=Actinoallomurus oryzae TaxID=502180 RepID=A0ABP8PIR8_9ACTN